MGNIYVENFADELDDELLREIFAKYGKIISAKVLVSEDGKSRGFGIVSFEEPKAAEEAVESVNGTDIRGRVIYCGPVQKFQERQTELEVRYETVKRETTNRCQGTNVYVKHLDGSIDDRLRGKITSAKVMTDHQGRSKGFGFVSFSSLEEAMDAVIQMNWSMLDGKPLYVALAQSKEERRAGYQQHMASQEQQLAAQERHVFLTKVAQVKARLEKNGIHQIEQICEGSVRRSNTSNEHKDSLNVISPGQEPLTAAMMAPFPLPVQKQMLGERLYPVIKGMYREVAGRITSMLLHLDNSELLHFLTSQEKLLDKVKKQQLTAQCSLPTSMLLPLDNCDLLHFLKSEEMLKVQVR